jgi:hypothetical protein
MQLHIAIIPKAINYPVWPEGGQTAVPADMPVVTATSKTFLEQLL